MANDDGQQRRQRPGAARCARGVEGRAGGGEVHVAGVLQVAERHPQRRRKVKGFFGLGQEQTHKTETSFSADHPEIFASEDKGVTPVEYMLVGLASCLTAGVAAVAQNRGIQLRSVEAKLEGKMDIRGILGIDSDVRNGYDDIKVTFKIDADASKKEIEALVAQSQKRSAVYDVITNPTNVTVEVAVARRDGTQRAEADAHRARHDGRHRRRPRRPRGEPLPHRRGRSITSCSSAARSRTPGAASAGTRCACSRRTGRAACRAIATTAPTPTAT